MYEPSRRAVLASTVAIASAGCTGRVRNIAGRETPSQVSLEIRTTPADSDPYGIRVARHLAEHLSEVGIDARVNTTGGEADLYRRVLLNHDFDLYVGQFPESEAFDPDTLYPLCHSAYNAETGWQNPFGFSDLTVDDLLEHQRVAPETDRSGYVTDLQTTLADLQPFTVVAFPDALTAVRDSGFVGWEESQPTSTRGILSLRYAGADEDGGNLRLATTDERITENWNPIAAEYRRHGKFTGLLYDPLIRIENGRRIPWLAHDREWVDDTTVRLDLRDARWHDGEPLDAEDVAFTYEFYADTSMGTAESPVPAPRFRGRSSLVSDARAVDDGVVEITVADASRGVAERALTVPILPKHIWTGFTDPATIAGFEIDEELTEALVHNNEDPVGCGPIRFSEATPGEEVVFERNEEHFLQSSPDGIPEEYHGSPAFERMVIEWVPSDIAAVQRVGDGLAHATVSNLGPDAVPRIGREADARLVSSQSAAFYHVGYNVRRAPLSNPRFRQVIAGCIDKAFLVDDAFEGYATPAATPLASTPEWVPSELAFEDEDPVHPFVGTDGELDAERVREAFRDAGYRYNEDGELIIQDG